MRSQASSIFVVGTNGTNRPGLAMSDLGGRTKVGFRGR